MIFLCRALAVTPRLTLLMAGLFVLQSISVSASARLLAAVRHQLTKHPLPGLAHDKHLVAGRVGCVRLPRLAMADAALAARELPASGHPESSRRALVRLQLRHCLSVV